MGGYILILQATPERCLDAMDVAMMVVIVPADIHETYRNQPGQIAKKPVV
ncbi:hypothetical protein CIPAW_01G093300 [Carya illinoinensis]|uniref:Uncharacterized protein n=1 Tax=Carya illinoinensis TaxID=32201 RepID=A0A8T1RKJ3_CARIL|nr:hypothetical protein CIPAW_01G093300 [Carya illinoinensis]